MARMVGADEETFFEGDAIVLARSAEQLLIDRLARAAERACRATIGAPAVAVIAGSGEFFARRLAERHARPRGSNPLPHRRVGVPCIACGLRLRPRPSGIGRGHSMPEHERREGEAPAERDRDSAPKERSKSHGTRPIAGRLASRGRGVRPMSRNGTENLIRIVTQPRHHTRRSKKAAAVSLAGSTPSG